ncbi:Xylose operon regulatory protein [Posidoniimonas corsicana]|uniref:Xylose operon regulatory protein n=1 Tax=Posidoniimonas corsicana TaxID=1938618 RepID=A0A5C5VBJ8_9BACT|nr:XylR family transcriptional regulator [Posidoniimonas corsicana]TWT35390.1 Xylose operon regulatory protein [Posidoniimonas corsicana]
MQKTPHVALLIETSREYARGLLRGVATYLRERGPWSIYFEPHGLDDPPPDWLVDWKGDGILARVNSREMADEILATGIPAIDLRGALVGLELPFIGVDNRPIAKLGYQHLRDLGLKNFAFCGTPKGENPNQDLRCQYFVELVEEDGAQCHVLLGEQQRQRAPSWEDQQQQIAAWLEDLPKPVGIMTCHDDRGQQVLDACRRASISVPDTVALISVDNDSHLCNLSTPPMTSIDVNPSRIGFAAAEMLGKMMRGKRPAQMTTLLGPPRGIAARRSTEMLAIDDADVELAIRYIRENATSGVRAADVVAQARSRPTTLERRFKSILGRTIKAEITRVRLDRAKLLLAETELNVSAIAVRTGFAEPKYFCEVFRKHQGVTATEYRKRFRDA